jgi:FKBP-type peptidyl-prolyl cis-trans isomerase SlyD
MDGEAYHGGRAHFKRIQPVPVGIAHAGLAIFLNMRYHIWDQENPHFLYQIHSKERIIMKISNHKFVTVEYTLSDDAGAVLDTSRGREPLTYVHGTGGLISGFETALDGRLAADKFSFVLAPKDGYGERNDSLIFNLPRERFSEVEDLKEGMQFAVNGPHGALVMTVTDAGEKEVTLDGNHPLAGSTLHFDVEVLQVRDATEEEIQESLQNTGCSCAADGTGEDSCKGCSDC